MVTFGHTKVGSDQRIMDAMRGSVAIALEAGTVYSLNAYLRRGIAGYHIKIALYDSSKQFLGSTDPIATIGNDKWYSGNVSIPVTAGTYYFGIISDDGGSTLTVAFDSDGITDWCYQPYTYPNFPATWVKYDTGRIFSIYATYMPFGAPPTPPTPDFTISEVPIVNKAVTFFGIITPGWDGNNPTTVADSDYVWTFSDGNTSIGATIQHVFTREGDAVVTLTVTDNVGQTNSVTHTIRVFASEHYVLDVGFENPKDSILLNAVPFPQGAIQEYPLQSEHSYDASTKPAFIGAVQSPMYPADPNAKALKIRLTAPEPITNIDDSRIHLRHLFNPMQDSDIWTESEVLIPPTFRWVSNQWIGFLSGLEELLWNYSGGVLSFCGHFFSISNEPSAYGDPMINPDGTHKLGTIVNHPTPAFARQDDNFKRYIHTVRGVPEGRPFKIRVHVHRPIDAIDPIAEDAGGYFEVWTNDYTVKDQWVKQVFYQVFAATWTGRTEGRVDIGDRVYCRTVGWNPYIEIAVCQNCGYMYDYVHYDGPPWVQLPDTYVCPQCGNPKTATGSTAWFILPPFSELPMTVPPSTTPEGAAWRSQYGMIRGWIESGVSFYTGSNTPDTYPLQNELYFDNLTLANTVPTPISPLIPLIGAGVLGAVTFWWLLKK